MIGIADRDLLLARSNYPGMIPAESRVLKEFIRRNYVHGDEFQFGVRIGEGVVLDETHPPEIRRAWEAITKARPDTVRFRQPNKAAIVEVKETWTNEAVWQLLAYRDLYRAAFPGHAVSMIGVAAWATPTARMLTSNYGIALYLYTMPLGTADVEETAPEGVTDGAA